jgi:hypothetical protein
VARETWAGRAGCSCLAAAKETWPLLAEATPHCEAHSRTKRHRFRRLLRSGPAHSESAPREATGARLWTKLRLDARSCFLKCGPESSGRRKKGLPHFPAYGFLTLLCNPFPVLDRHLSIVHRGHCRAEEFRERRDVDPRLPRTLSPDYFVLYNGPQCGRFSSRSSSLSGLLSESFCPSRTQCGPAIREAHCAVPARETAARGLEVLLRHRRLGRSYDRLY